jgi:hypothetical protein
VGRPRLVQPGQLIHESVFDKIERHDYFPKARIYNGLHWSNLKRIALEEDPYTKVAGIMDGLQKAVFDVPEQRLDLLLTLIKSSELWLYDFFYGLKLIIDCIELGQRSIYETEGAAKTLLRVLHKAVAKEDVDQARRQTSVNLLLGALLASRPTEDSKETFSKLDLIRPVTETARQDLTMRNVVLEVLKKFGPSECKLILNSCTLATDLPLLISAFCWAHRLGPVCRVLRRWKVGRFRIGRSIGSDLGCSNWPGGQGP